VHALDGETRPRSRWVTIKAVNGSTFKASLRPD